MNRGQFPKDDNGEIFVNPNLGFVAKKVMTFDGGTEDDPGDFDGAGNPADLFTVTGVVLVRIFARVTTNLAGASATIEVGTAKNTAGFLAQSTATDLDVDELWHDATPDASVELDTVAPAKVTIQDIIQTVATANITGGVIEYYAVWQPLSPESSVVSA